MKKRYTEEQIIGFLREADALTADQGALQLKRILANSMLELDAMRQVLHRK